MKTTDCACDTHAEARLSRRHLVATTALTGAAALTLPGLASASTPVAEPATSAVDQDRLMALSSRLAGGAKLDAAAGDALAGILAAEPGIDGIMSELEAVADFTPESLAATSPEAQRLATNLLQFWFLGRYDDQPVETRADMFFGLACWQAVPYFTQPTICKSFGYWAEDLESQLP